MAHTAEEWFQIGKEKFKIGLFDEANEAFDKVIALEPNAAMAHINRGAVKVELGEQQI